MSGDVIKVNFFSGERVSEPRQQLIDEAVRINLALSQLLIEPAAADAEIDQLWNEASQAVARLTSEERVIAQAKLNKLK